MDETNPQRTVPPPGRTQVRIGVRSFEMSDAAWEHWVRRGHVPPEALVISHRWTRGVWRQAGSLETYHLFRPSVKPPSPAGGRPASHPQGSFSGPDRLPVGSIAAGTRPGDWDQGSPRPGASSLPQPDLPRAIWGKGVSATHVLLLANLAVGTILLLAWGEAYSDHLWGFAERLRGSLSSGWIPVLFIPLFLHATPQHLLGNMLGLLAGGAAVEEFYGRKRTFVLYLASGIAGALFSLLREKPVLSVGASGAIMGMYGVILVFLIRYRRHFTERQKFKTIRIYLPLLALAVLPSIFRADLLSHVGGFLGGVLLSLIISPRPNLVPWAQIDTDPDSTL